MPERLQKAFEEAERKFDSRVDGDVAIKFIEQRNEDAIPTVIHVEA